MNKTIPVDALKVGMYLAEPAYDNNGDLLIAEHITLTSQNQIHQMQRAGVELVLIDPEKGEDCDPGRELTPESSAPQITITKVKTPPSVGLIKPSGIHKPVLLDASAIKPADFPEELERADEIKKQATSIARKCYEEARAGQAMDTEEAQGMVTEMIGSIFRNQFAFLSLAKLKEYDEYTFNHSVNVTTYTIAIAKGMGFDQGQLQDIGVSTFLHDVGKTKIPQRILNKPGKLDEEEWKVMKQHVRFGADLLIESGFSEEESVVALQHHERYDGAGYLGGRKRDDIHLYARIASICDVYDAMTAKRVYKPALMPHLALALIYKGKETQFSPEIVMGFIKIIGIYPIGSLVKLSSGEVGVVVSVNDEDLKRPKVSIVFSRRGIMKRQPIMIDLEEERQSSIIAALDPKEWKIRIEDFIHNVSV
ncbi:HD-GYP domain-containing protein [candidate division KSB1 bacterium]